MVHELGQFLHKNNPGLALTLVWKELPTNSLNPKNSTNYARNSGKFHRNSGKFWKNSGIFLQKLRNLTKTQESKVLTTTQVL